MSKKQNKVTAQGAAEKKAPCVYCGPTVRGVVKQYTIYAGEVNKALANFLHRNPTAQALLVPLEKFAQTRKQVETPGTTENILYHKIKSEL